MIFDKTLMFSENQSVIGGSVISTNVVDLGKSTRGLVRDIGKGTGTPILIQVVEDFVGNDGLQVVCEISSKEDFSTDVDDLWVTPVAGVSKLKAGYVFTPEVIARGANKRYMRLKYLSNGSFTAGNVTAGITMGNQSNG